MKLLYYLGLLVLVVIGGLYLDKTGWVSIPFFKNPQVQTLTASLPDSKVKAPDLEKYIPKEQIPAEINETVAGIYHNAQTASTIAAQVLGTAIEATASDKPIQEQAWEYGKYLYCQQVVEQWEALQSGTE